MRNYLLTILILAMVSTTTFGYVDAAKINENFKKSFEKLSKVKTEKERIQERAYIALSAELQLGLLFGTPAQAKETFDYVQKAADMNISCAQHSMSQFYYNGSAILDEISKQTVQVVPIDKELSIKWLKRSAEGGCPEGLYEFGLSYRNGDGVLENDKLAHKWFQKAAQNGHIRSMILIALDFATGRGCTIDKVQALAWVTFAESENQSDHANRQDFDDKTVKIMHDLKQQLKDQLAQNKIEKAQDIAVTLKAMVDKNNANRKD